MEHVLLEIVKDFSKDSIWLGSENQVYLYNEKAKTLKPYTLNNFLPEQIMVRKVNSKAVFFLSEGLFSYNTTLDSMEQIKSYNFIDDLKFVFSSGQITQHR